MKLTPLNHETTARYRACLSAGTHMPGARLLDVHRVYKGIDERMPICDTCEVPFPGSGLLFTLRGKWAFDEEAA
jgi:hypothetical protein